MEQYYKSIDYTIWNLIFDEKDPNILLYNKNKDKVLQYKDALNKLNSDCIENVDNELLIFKYLKDVSTPNLYKKLKQIIGEHD